MSVVSQVVIACAVFGLVAASISAPFLLPWSLRVRYLVDAPWTDPFLGLGPAPRLEMRAVTLSALDIRHGDVEVGFDEIGGRRTSVIRFDRSGCAPGVIARFDGWMALRTPLLVMMWDRGQVHIYGPDDEVTELTIAGVASR
jgi:hypothetical protein